MDHNQRQPILTQGFPWEILSEKDFLVALDFLQPPKCGQSEDKWGLPLPDMVIAPDGDPYIYRWHLARPNDEANVYFHIQVTSDPERPLHDHPWNNASQILSGGYNERIATPWARRDGKWILLHQGVRKLRKGDVVTREAGMAHRLELPEDTPYTMTLFTTGKKVKEWGFWVSDIKWLPHHSFTKQLDDGRNVWSDEGRRLLKSTVEETTHDSE